MSGKPPLQFEWLRNGIPLEKNERVSIATTEDLSTLTFRQLKIEDAANYTCIAKNREGMDAFTAKLRMNCKFDSKQTVNCHNMWFLVSPEWISEPQEVLKVKEGSSVEIECKARGEPEPTVTIERKHGRTCHLLILLARLWLQILPFEMNIRFRVEETHSIRRKVYKACLQVRCRLIQVSSWKRDWTTPRKRLRTSSFKYWKSNTLFCKLVLPAKGQYYVVTRNEAL